MGATKIHDISILHNRFFYFFLFLCVIFIRQHGMCQIVRRFYFEIAIYHLQMM